MLLDSFGRPAELTTYFRKLGDPVIPLDTREPICSHIRAESLANVITPRAMAATMNRILLGDALRAGSQQHLTEWMIDQRTGVKRLRAGLPSDWRIGDKTGSGDRSTANDVAIVWPPNRPPLLIAVFFTGAGPAMDRDRPVAEVGRLIGRLYAE